MRGYSQGDLGARAGIDEASASARISQYETGKHLPHFDIACRLAGALEVPPAFFYSTDDETAALLLGWDAAEPAKRQIALKLLKVDANLERMKTNTRRRRRR
ncbi:putative transcriptional regulator [Piscinibacter sakaiensis]|uniref:Putative transcriptional regulator n=2 Tax=Piscinibacter sakaiensis TaxID=1547922 RepID=A0A0K8P910_PISS1|nr:putative transcriptional regulator [Piscinibacter sakaiensis]